MQAKRERKRICGKLKVSTSMKFIGISKDIRAGGLNVIWVGNESESGWRRTCRQDRALGRLRCGKGLPIWRRRYIPDGHIIKTLLGTGLNYFAKQLREGRGDIDRIYDRGIWGWGCPCSLKPGDHGNASTMLSYVNSVATPVALWNIRMFKQLRFPCFSAEASRR